jgi:hypothetical protein
LDDMALTQGFEEKHVGQPCKVGQALFSASQGGRAACTVTAHEIGSCAPVRSTSARLGIPLICSGLIDMRAQAEMLSARRSDTPA